MELEALVRHAAMGDKRAWRLLTARLTPRLRGFFTSKYSALDCKDMVQETLLVIWNKLPGFEMRGEAAFLSWVRKIAQYVALDALRQSTREAKLARALDQVERQPSTRLSSRLDRARARESLRRAIDGLAPSYRRAVENMLEGGDARQLAERVGIKWKSARVLEHRTRLLLRRRMGLPTPKS